MLVSLVIALVVSSIITQVAVFSTTIYLHRTATHKALSLKPPVEWAFKFALWITTGILTKEWVAVHRKHHAFTDEEGDPHSPALEGFWKVQLGNVFYYLRELRSSDVIDRYARDINEGWWDRHVFNRGLLGLTIGTVALCLVLGLGWGLLAAAVHAVMIAAMALLSMPPERNIPSGTSLISRSLTDSSNSSRNRATTSRSLDRSASLAAARLAAVGRSQY